MNIVKNQTLRLEIVTSCLLGFLAVAIGAFGAHGLKEMIGPDRMSAFETGSRHHFYHAIVSIFILLISDRKEMNSFLKNAYWFFIGGIILFSFSLYAMAVTGIKILGIITPFGGVFFLIAWILLGIGMNQAFSEPKKN